MLVCVVTAGVGGSSGACMPKLCVSRCYLVQYASCYRAAPSSPSLSPTLLPLLIPLEKQLVCSKLLQGALTFVMEPFSCAALLFIIVASGVSSALSLSNAATRLLALHTYDLASFPLAVCNDGTPSGYYYSPSPSASSAVWLVHQEGGGWVFDASSAVRRNSNLTSSKEWPATLEVGGIFASKDVRLADANLVYAKYCTSDAWSGNIAADHVPFGFHFRGHQVVSALFTDLIRSHGLGSKPATALLYSGCSAGARGVLFNADRVVQLVTSLVPHGNIARYGALLDSAFWVDIAPFNASVVSFVTQTQLVYALANASASVSPSCQAAFPAPEQWKCLFGEFAAPYLQSRYLLHAFLYDQFQLTSDYGIPFNSPPPDSTPEELAFNEAFRNFTYESALRDTINPARAGTAALLPACYMHCNTEGARFETMLTEGVTLEQATLSWFFSDASVPAYVVEGCKGFNCGPHCPSA